MTNMPDLQAAEDVARADVADSVTAWMAAKLAGDVEAIATAQDTLERCISEFSARHADLINAAGTGRPEAGGPEPEPETGP
jgi:hypothetical protein